jgi:hypothetical protein
MGTVQEGIVSFPDGPEGNCEYGLATREEGQLQDLTGEVDGIWGMAPGGGIEGLVQCLVREGKISHSVMSLHLTDIGGSISIGDVPQEAELQTIPVVGNGKTWSVPLLSVFVQRHPVGGRSSKQKPADVLGGPQPALLDTGSSGLRAPSSAIEHLAWALAAERNNDGKFVVPCESRLQPPDIILRLGSENNPVDVSLNLENLLGADDGRGWCSLGLNPSSSGQWILGGTFFRRVQAVVFDYDRSQVKIAVGADSASSPGLRPRTTSDTVPSPPPSQPKNAPSAAMRLAADTGAFDGNSSESWTHIGEDIQGDAGEMGVDVRPNSTAKVETTVQDAPVSPSIRKLLAGRFGMRTEEGTPVAVPEDRSPEVPAMPVQKMDNGTQWKDLSKNLTSPVESEEMSNDIAKELDSVQENQEQAALEGAADAAQQEAKKAGLKMPNANPSSASISPSGTSATPSKQTNQHESSETMSSEPDQPAQSNPPAKIREVVDYFNDRSDPEKLSDQIEENKETERLANAVKSGIPGAKVDDGSANATLSGESSANDVGSSNTENVTIPVAKDIDRAEPAMQNTDSKVAVQGDDMVDKHVEPVVQETKAAAQGDGVVDKHVEPVVEETKAAAQGDGAVDKHVEPVVEDVDQPKPVVDQAKAVQGDDVVDKHAEPVVEDVDQPQPQPVVDQAKAKPAEDNSAQDNGQSASSSNALAPGPPPKDPPKKIGGGVVVPPLSAQAGIVGGLVPGGSGLGGFQPSSMAAVPVHDTYPSIENPYLAPTPPVQFSNPVPMSGDQEIVPSMPASAPGVDRAASEEQPTVVDPEASVGSDDAQPVAVPAINHAPSSLSPEQDDTISAQTAPTTPVDDPEEDRLKRETSRWDDMVKRAEQREVHTTASASTASTVPAEDVPPPTLPPVSFGGDLSHFDMGNIMDKAREVVKAQGVDNWDRPVSHDHSAKLEPMKPLKHILKRVHQADLKHPTSTATSAEDNDDYGYGMAMNRGQDVMARLNESSQGLEDTEPITTKAKTVNIGQDDGSGSDVEVLSPSSMSASIPQQDSHESAAVPSSDGDSSSSVSSASVMSQPLMQPLPAHSNPNLVPVGASTDHVEQPSMSESSPQDMEVSNGQSSEMASPPHEDTASNGMVAPPAADVPVHPKRLSKSSQKTFPRKHVPTGPASRRAKTEFDDLDKVAQDAVHWAQRFQKEATPLSSSDQEIPPEPTGTVELPASSSPVLEGSAPQSQSGDSNSITDAPVSDSPPSVPTNEDPQDSQPIKLQKSEDVDNLAAQAQHWAHRWDVKATAHRRVSTATDAPTLARGQVEVQPVHAAVTVPGVAAQAHSTWLNPDLGSAAHEMRSAAKALRSSSNRESKARSAVTGTGVPGIDNLISQADAWEQLYRKPHAAAPTTEEAAESSVEASNPVSMPITESKPLPEALSITGIDNMDDVTASTSTSAPKSVPSEALTSDFMIDQVLSQSFRRNSAANTVPAVSMPEVSEMHPVPDTTRMWKAAAKHFDISLSTGTARLRGRSDSGMEPMEPPNQEVSRVDLTEAADTDPDASVFRRAEREDQVWLARYRKH